MSQPRPGQRPARPQHTTLVGCVVIGASVGVVVTVAEQLAGLHSLESRELVADFLSEPPGNRLGLDLAGALLGWRIALMVVAGLATVAALLGYHALQRSHRARAGLAVVAVPLFLGGLVAGGVLTSVVAAAALMLWLGPSREFFDGVAPRRDDGPPGTPTSSPPPAPTAPPPVAGPQTWQPPPGHQPATAQPAPDAGVRPGQANRRPDAVVWACVLTWAMCAIVLTVMAASVVLVATDPGVVLEQLRAQGSALAGTSAVDLQDATYAGAAVVGTWSLVAVVLAAFAYRGAGWARVLVLVSASGAGVVCLVAAVTSVLLVLPAGGCLAVVVLLTRPEVRAWFGRSRARAV